MDALRVHGRASRVEEMSMITVAIGVSAIPYPIGGKAESFDETLLTQSIVLVIPMIHLSCMSTLPLQDLYFESTQFLHPYTPHWYARN